MKKVDLLVLRTFAGPFLSTFFIVVLFFVLQFFYIYIDDFVGKGLEWYIVAELVFYLSANVVPLGLPLAVLLSSIMTFGNLGERYELTALKSSGISLAQTMRSSIAAIILLSIGSLIFSDRVMPQANLKFYTTLFDITQSKPALDIKENVFYNEIENYVIKIARKGRDNRQIYGVYIANQSSRRPNDDIMLADSGVMFTSADRQFLVLRLYNGSKYEILQPERGKEQQKRMTVTRFDEMEKVFDLSEFKMTRTDEQRYKNHYIMMNIRQLSYFIDSLQVERKQMYEATHEIMTPYFHFYRDTLTPFSIPEYAGKAPDSLFATRLHTENLSTTYNRAIAFSKTVKDRLQAPIIMRLDNFDRMIVRAKLEWNRKYMLAASCLLLLFVGAPFGALVRKGGFGYPVLFAIVFYVVYYIMFKVGEDMAKKELVTPFVGMWAGTFILAPLAFWFTMKAMNDSSLLLADQYRIGFDRLQKRVRKWLQ